MVVSLLVGAAVAAVIFIGQITNAMYRHPFVLQGLTRQAVHKVPRRGGELKTSPRGRSLVHDKGGIGRIISSAIANDAVGGSQQIIITLRHWWKCYQVLVPQMVARVGEGLLPLFHRCERHEGVDYLLVEFTVKVDTLNYAEVEP